MALHFSDGEFTARRARVIADIERRQLSGLLVFKQETMYYLTGYDSFGYVFFQCMYLGCDGALTLLTRLPDLRQAEHTSNIEDIRIWTDSADADPIQDLVSLCVEHGVTGRRLGIEQDAYGLTYSTAVAIRAQLEVICGLEDASNLVDRIRAIKSPAEIEYTRRAAALGDAALERANALARARGLRG